MLPNKYQKRATENLMWSSHSLTFSLCYHSLLLLETWKGVARFWLATFLYGHANYCQQSTRYSHALRFPFKCAPLPTLCRRPICVGMETGHKHAGSHDRQAICMVQMCRGSTHMYALSVWSAMIGKQHYWSQDMCTKMGISTAHSHMADISVVVWSQFTCACSPSLCSESVCRKISCTVLSCS